MARLATQRRGAGSVPTMIGPPSISGAPTQGQVLTCNDGTYAGLMPRTITRQWFRGASTLLAGEVNSTYTVAVGDVGSTLKCTVTVSNYLGSFTVSTPNTAVAT